MPEARTEGDGVRHVPLRDGLRLAVRELGNGPPLLLVHGFTGSGEAWGEPLLGRLAARRRVLAVDLPGHGRSDAPPDPGRYRMEHAVRDLEEVLDRLGVDRPVWVGYSMGGRVTLGAAVLRPDRVGAAVLESASPGLETAAERADRRRSDDALARSILEEGIEPFVTRWMALPLFATQRRLPPRVRARERRRRLSGRPEGLAGSLRGLGTGRQPSFWDQLGALRMPVHLLVGEDDAKYVEIAERMRERIPDARLHRVAGAGHTVHLEAPDAWVERVLAVEVEP